MSKEYPCFYFDNMKCKKFSEDGDTDWCVLGPCSHETPSNADRIRAMSDEELVVLLTTHRNCPVPKNHVTCGFVGTCAECWLDWLKQPYKEDA